MMVILSWSKHHLAGHEQMRLAAAGEYRKCTHNNDHTNLGTKFEQWHKQTTSE
jgi:hypothetical protein